MKKLPTPPAFQLYAAQFIAGTASMSDAEVGAYMRLLCHQWLDGSVPNDVSKLRRLAGSSRKTIDAVVVKFPVGDDGNRRNAKLEQVRTEQDEYRAERRAAGMAGAEKRWHSHSSANGSAIAKPSPSHAFANGKPMANEWQNDGSSSSSSSSELRQQQQTNSPSARTDSEPGAAVAAAAADFPRPAEPDTPPQARSPVADALVAAGVSEPTRTQLAALEGITAEIVNACAKRAKASGKGIGAVVQDIRTAVEAARVKAAAPPPGPTREQLRVREATEHALRVDAERKRAQEVISALSDGELTAFHQAALRTLKPSDPVYTAWQHADPRDPGKYHGLRAAIVRLVMDTKTERATA